MNTIGKMFCLTSFGESHGEAIGGIIDGCPAGLDVDLGFIQNELDRRKPGQSEITTQRKEEDKIEILSGIFEGKTTGSPIGFIIRNTNQKTGDYENLKGVFRPSSADYTYFKKYGIRDYRGGGRASARETAARVAGAAIAKLLLKKNGIVINAYTSQIGEIKLDKSYKELDLAKLERNFVRCPDNEIATKMIDLINNLKARGDSIGGIVTCVIKGVPVGLGEPVYDKLHADLGKAMLSINAAKGFEYGSGFEDVTKKGSELNDSFVIDTRIKTQDTRLNNITTLTNYSGGIQGGISNGQDIYFRVVFKPTSSISKKQQTIDVEGKSAELEIKGRHDPCIVPRAVPVVEAMAALTIADHLLRYKAYERLGY